MSENAKLKKDNKVGTWWNTKGTSCSFNKDSEHVNFKSGIITSFKFSDVRNTFEKGKSVGRNAFIIYLGKQDIKDSIDIHLDQLLAIEDSLAHTPF